MENELEKSYFFDINKIYELVFTDYNERTKDVEIVEEFAYDDEGKQIPVSKEVRETKTSDLSGQTMRYDVLKGLMDSLDTIELDSNGNPTDMSLGQLISLNTLQAYGIITK